MYNGLPSNFDSYLTREPDEPTLPEIIEEIISDVCVINNYIFAELIMDKEVHETQGIFFDFQNETGKDVTLYPYVCLDMNKSSGAKDELDAILKASKDVQAKLAPNSIDKFKVFTKEEQKQLLEILEKECGYDTKKGEFHLEDEEKDAIGRAVLIHIKADKTLCDYVNNNLHTTSEIKFVSFEEEAALEDAYYDKLMSDMEDRE